MHVHDSRVLSYEVFCRERRIILHTEYRDDGEPFEYTDIIFSGVVAYKFKNDGVFGTIILDIDEIPPTKIYESQQVALQEGIKWGWVDSWAKDRESASQYFEKNSLRGFEIVATLGLEGWIIASSMEQVPTRLRLTGS